MEVTKFQFDLFVQSVIRATFPRLSLDGFTPESQVISQSQDFICHKTSLYTLGLNQLGYSFSEGLTHVTTLNFLNNKIDAIQDMHVLPEQRVRFLRFQGNHVLDVPKPESVSFGVERLTVISNHFPCNCHVHALLEGPLANGSVGDFVSSNFCISAFEDNGKPLAEVDLESIGRCQEEVTRENLEASKDAGGALRCDFRAAIAVLFWLWRS